MIPLVKLLPFFFLSIFLFHLYHFVFLSFLMTSSVKRVNSKLLFPSLNVSWEIAHGYLAYTFQILYFSLPSTLFFHSTWIIRQCRWNSRIKKNVKKLWMEWMENRKKTRKNITCNRIKMCVWSCYRLCVSLFLSTSQKISLILVHIFFRFPFSKMILYIFSLENIKSEVNDFKYLA